MRLPIGEKLKQLRANLCYLYLRIGQQEKADALGRTLPHIWECREVLMPGLVPPSQRRQAVERLLSIARQVLADVEADRAIPFSLGYRAQ